ncbi:MAG: AAA family ATPase [Pseudomonadota bacterium]
MQRVMIIGQPGSGKSTLAKRLGELTYLPVIHIDLIHWMPGWIERDRVEKTRMTLQVIAEPKWIFEGGHSATWPQRLERADTLIWLDFPLNLRAWRVLKRTLRHYGRTRPDLPEGCPEHFSWEFWGWIWRTRRTSRTAMRKLFDGAPKDKTTYHLRSPSEVRGFLLSLGKAVSIGNLGVPHHQIGERQ